MLMTSLYLECTSRSWSRLDTPGAAFGVTFSVLDNMNRVASAHLLKLLLQTQLQSLLQHFLKMREDCTEVVVVLCAPARPDTYPASVRSRQRPICAVGLETSLVEFGPGWSNFNKGLRSFLTHFSVPAKSGDRKSRTGDADHSPYM